LRPAEGRKPRHAAVCRPYRLRRIAAAVLKKGIPGLLPGMPLILLALS